MAMLAEASTHPQFLEGFGFVLEAGPPPGGYDEVPVVCEVPVVANLGDQGIVCWLDADASLLSLNGTAHGIRLDQVRGARVEAIPRQPKATIFPELVVEPTWPPIALNTRGAEMAESDARGWPAELRITRVPLTAVATQLHRAVAVMRSTAQRASPAGPASPLSWQPGALVRPAGK